MHGRRSDVRVLITDTVMLNTGDAAVLLGTIRALRLAFGDTIDIEVADAQPAVAARHYPEIRFLPTVHDRLAAWLGGSGAKYKLGVALVLATARVWTWKPAARLKKLLPAELRRVIERYAAADFVVAAGGTYLVPHYRLTPRLVNFLTVMALGKPLVLFTQSMGPFRGRLNRILLRAVLRRSALVLLRDDMSRRHLQSLGISTEHTVVLPDAAFALAPAIPCGPPAPRDDERPNVAISLRDWPHFGAADTSGMTRYVAAVADLVRDLVEQKHARITFLSTCQGADEYWTDDSAIADRVTQRLPPHVLRHVEVDRLHRRPENLMRRFKDFDCVVATRMHAAILALCAGRPVVAIAYEFKSRELFRRLGMGELVVDIEDVTCERLLAAVDALMRNRNTLAETVRRQVSVERRAALAAGNHVLQAVRMAGLKTWQTR